MGHRLERQGAQHHKVTHKTDACQRHEDDGYAFYQGRVEMRKAGIVGRKSAQTHGGAHVHEGVGPAHARPSVSQQASARKQKVHTPQAARCLGNARREFGVFHGAGGFGLVELHPAQTQHGQHRHHQQHDAQATDQLQKTAPDVHRHRQVLQPRQSRGPGGRERAHGFKVGLEPGDLGHQKHQRQSRIGRQDQPHHVDQQETVFGLQFAPVALCDGRQQQATGCRQAKTRQPYPLQIVVVFKPGPNAGHQKGDRERDQDARHQRQHGGKSLEHQPKKVALT